MTSPRARFVLTLVLALAAGGVVGAGVALQWYGPAVAVVLAALMNTRRTCTCWCATWNTRPTEASWGKLRARQVMEFWASDHYTWVYQTVLDGGSEPRRSQAPLTVAWGPDDGLHPMAPRRIMDMGVKRCLDTTVWCIAIRRS